MNRISDRIEALRRFMQTKGISAFIVPSTDPHSGEYVPAHWESRKWISGFTGSAGTAVITMSQGGLWTDSRYFLQAEEQLQGSGLILLLVRRRSKSWRKSRYRRMGKQYVRSSAMAKST